MEDVLQATFLAVHKTLSADPAPDVALRPYIMGIAHHNVVDYYRSRHRKLQSEVEGGEAFDELADLSPSAFEIRAAVEDQDFLVKALMLIPRADQALLYAIYWEEIPHGDLAGILNIPPGTLRSRLFLARKRLSGALADPLTKRISAPSLEQWGCEFQRINIDILNESQRKM